MKKGIYGGITLSPQQPLCLLCYLGKNPEKIEEPLLNEIFSVIEKKPDIPVTLRCHAGDVFSFQDIKENYTLSTRRKNLEILQKLDLFPGITITARILFIRILHRITTVKDICFDCDFAIKKYYERARKQQLSLIVEHCGQFGKSILAEKAKKKNIKIIIPPRTLEDLMKSKQKSLDAMYQAKNEGIRVRPHILLCSICQYGAGAKPTEVYDNLPELLALVLKETDVKITLVEGADWMMCGPCPSKTEENFCVHAFGKCGLPSQLRDMRVLETLGLDYGMTIDARTLYKKIIEKIPSTLLICRFDNPQTSMWHSGCGQRTENNPDYVKGRRKLMAKLNVRKGE
ncbi:MAG: hypothetical protein ACPL3Q_01365 [Candidatus Ratteibacteria bacterium]